MKKESPSVWLKSVHDLELHEVAVIESESQSNDMFYTTAMRVPGGWIYRSINRSQREAFAVFVPYSVDLKDKKDKD